MRHKKKVIAPRLKSLEPRISIGHGLPSRVKEGIRSIARHENQSVSWVLEQIIIDYFGFEKPEYLERKNETNQRTRITAYRHRTSKAS
jgi:hypothetical protein